MFEDSDKLFASTPILPQALRCRRRPLRLRKKSWTMRDLGSSEEQSERLNGRHAAGQTLHNLGCPCTRKTPSRAQLLLLAGPILLVCKTQIVFALSSAESELHVLGTGAGEAPPVRSFRMVSKLLNKLHHIIMETGWSSGKRLRLFWCCEDGVANTALVFVQPEGHQEASQSVWRTNPI